MLSFANMVPLIEDEAFKAVMFEDPKDWTAKSLGHVVVFTRGNVNLDDDRDIVTHGTTLSNAHTILRSGIRVGFGHHAHHGLQMHGWFCIADGPIDDRIQAARNRSTANRCLEFQRKNWPTGWTVPCVLAWHPWEDTRVIHLTHFADGCWKSCIPAMVGTQRLLPHDMSLIINYRELQAYTVLQEIQPHSELWMICGGKHRYPNYWAADGNNMAATCGNCIRIDELLSENSSSLWRRMRGSKVWFCPDCDANFSRPIFWN